MKKIFNPCDECNYSYSKNNESTNMCKICEFKQYRNLEEQGLLHKAPFRIGQPIWMVGNELINGYVIKQFIVTEEGIEAVKISKEINGKEYWHTFYTESWLVYVFPTKAEAEKKLAEMKN